MQWTNETLGGFTENVTSWLPVDPTAEYNNVLVDMLNLILVENNLYQHSKSFMKPVIILYQTKE